MKGVLFSMLLLSIRAWHVFLLHKILGISSDLDVEFSKGKEKKKRDRRGKPCVFFTFFGIFHYNTATTSAWHWELSHSGVSWIDRNEINFGVELDTFDLYVFFYHHWRTVWEVDFTGVYYCIYEMLN